MVCMAVIGLIFKSMFFFDENKVNIARKSEKIHNETLMDEPGKVEG